MLSNAALAINEAALNVAKSVGFMFLRFKVLL
ncbi:MAG: hypothetical protein JWN13_5521 [Betaproteobacteria bacterium]|nr:hypothetical protein [Betaproteobacteria bacterium]